MHNLTKTLAAMSLLAPLTAHSLGVGDIKLHSALNQKLSAEIALSLAADEDLSDIRVTLATPDKFDKLGISWSYFLSRVKFQPVVKANGKVVIKVTSDEVVLEPFLDFLVEVSWPKGDIYKEFTVLVDPPVIYQQSNVDVAVLQQSTQQTSQYSRNTAVAQNDSSKMSVDGVYGPTSRNDSLWKVAEKVNNDSDISVEQMMMALYKANPRAFYKKNVNALMEGKTLRIPKKADIVQLSKKQANTQFYRQMAVWEGRAVPEPDVQQTAANDSNSNQLTLVPPTEEQLTSSEALTPDTTEAVDTTNQANLATENRQLQERLANLEKQFAIMQEMMAIKDQQLAVMQNAQTDTNIVADSLTEGHTPVKIDTTVDSLSEEASNQKPVPVKDPIQGTATELVGKPPKATPLAQVKPQVHKVAEQQGDGDSYYYLGLGLLGLLAIGGIGWLFWRRRQEEEEINENSMFATSSEIFLPDTDGEDELDLPIFDERSSYDVGTVGESSFLSEFTPSDFDVFDTDQAEVDPTSETDVYLAYGRYQQAEELMRQAITDHSDNDDYKLKLLEIFYTSENAEAYEEYSRELISEGKNSDVNFWSKVIEMGKELIPGSALFLPEQSEAVYSTADELTEDSSNANNEDEVGLPNISEPDEVSTAVSGEDSSDLDFDLSEFSLPDDNSDELLELEEDVIIAEGDSDIESIDFDLSAFDLPDSSANSDLEETSSLDISSNETIETVEFNADETDDVNLDDFDFSSEDLAFSDTQDTVSDKTQSDEESDNSDFDFDFNFDEVSDVPVVGLSSDSDGQNENNLLVSDLTDMDEFETKIDLAKAYIDMGDESAAKEIAQEVLDKGSEAQKTEAQVIIDQLS